jgi:agmatine deiminase
MNIRFTVLFLLLFAANACVLVAQEVHLPKGLTPAEARAMPSYRPPDAAPNALRVPPSVPVRTMAEWEQCQGVMITWTSFQEILRQIVAAAQTEANVYIVCADSEAVKTYLTTRGTPLTNVKFLIQPFNSIWCRDFGPWAVYQNTADSLRLVDWIYNRPRPRDDTVSVGFARWMNLPLYQTIGADALTNTGGNFMVDGLGTAFASTLIRDENPSLTEAQIDTLMKRYMGITRYIKMPILPYDQIHHIDMHLKLLDEETLLVGEYPTGISDGPQIEANLQYVLTNFRTAYNRPFKVVRIPMPPDAQGRYPSNGGQYRTYTNSLIINKTVIIPTYELRYDTTAFRIYRNAMPGYRIVGIDCNAIIPSLGTIHCITKEIGVMQPLFISHAKLPNTTQTAQPYPVRAFAKSSGGITSATLFWRSDSTQSFSSVPMTIQGDTLRGAIPTQPVGRTVQYYIAATANNTTVTKPLTARVLFVSGSIRTFNTDGAYCAFTLCARAELPEPV